MIVLFIILFLIGMSLYYGYRGDLLKIDFSIEIKYYSNPYFNIGLSFDTEHLYEDDNNPDNIVIHEQLVIGLFFINFLVEFYKFKA